MLRINLKIGILVAISGDYYTWSEKDIIPYNSILSWLWFKFTVIFYSLFSFFLLTSATALLVRVLISSGVVILFPCFWAIQYLGFQPISDHIIRLSYPWIGVPMEMLRFIMIIANCT